MISSRRFRNSGRKNFAKFVLKVFSSGVLPSAKRSAHRFDVKITIVFLKFTFRPFESVRLPSSRICRNKLKTSGCAFSTSSKSRTLYGFLRTLSVNWPPSSCPM